ncbi:hypothetical protein [Lactococcus sp. DD01]|uniref:hypothetical protein n=1 Tax=Lactococcus sp. DD01 TaxID=1776443 RepID=UPI0007911282|nr:hypothetical protein [Lactococcus sp. DD01]KXT62315.1 hypothetical protein LACDD01_00827 [Lactococcus sp. DD01]
MKINKQEMLDQHKDEIINLYLVERRTQTQIIKQFGISKSSLYKFLNQNGIKKQSIPDIEAPPKATIKRLGEKFDVKIYKEPKTNYHYITGIHDHGFQVREYIAKEFKDSYAALLYIIPKGFESKFSKVITKKNLIYPDTKD